jgi:hypothetical protein
VSHIAPFTMEVPASELPESVLARFPERPALDARFTVTVEPAMSRDEKLAALRREIDMGLEELDAGRGIDGASVFAELKKRFPTE